MSLPRRKKPVEFHFVDMNDPDRYKKLKVSRACDFCRRRKSKCDIGVPGSGTCSNCQKHQMVCIFSPVTTIGATPTLALNQGSELIRPEEALLTPMQFTTYENFLFRFPLLQVKDGHVGYEATPSNDTQYSPILTPPITTKSKEPSLKLETKLFNLYFDHVHAAFPMLLKQSVMNIHSQDRYLLSRGLRYAIMALSCRYFPKKSPSLPSTPGSCTSLNNDFSPTSVIASQFFCEVARQALNLSLPRLDTVQTLLLLYQHDEMVGSPGGYSIHYLERAQEMIGQLQSIVPQQQEMINRARWILFGCIGLSNLTDPRYSKLYKHVDLPVELPQPITEEIEDADDSSAQQHVNRFAQIANLSVLYSHTVQSMITGSTSHLICLKQFKEIRQHWHDSLHPVTQSRLVSLCANDAEEIDILILYSAILYDMLYLLLLSHYHLENEWDGMETSYRLQRMIHTWAVRPTFLSAIHSRRMASFALMLCLQVQMTREDGKVDCDFIQELQKSMSYIQLDSRIDKELDELYSLLTSSNANHIPQIQIQQQQQPMDYFSIIPQHMKNSSISSPAEIAINTPGLWSVTTHGGGMTTPIREEVDQSNYQVTSEWIREQQRHQDEQLQLYQSQQIPQYHTTLPSTYTSNSINYSSSNNNTPLAITPSFNTNHGTHGGGEDYFYLDPGQWSPSIDQLNQSTNYLKLHNNTPTREVPPFVLRDLPPPPPPPVS